MAGIVYLICDPSQDLFKIGITKKLTERRLKQLQTGNGTELHIVHAYKTDYPFMVEKLMHDKFVLKHEHGEWFRLTNEDVLNFNKNCLDCEAIISTLKDNHFMKNKLK